MSQSQREISRFVPVRSEANDPGLWPRGWDVGRHPALADVAPEWVEPYLLDPAADGVSFYRRTAERDAAVRARYERGPRNPVTGDLVAITVADPDNLLHRNGLPVVLNPATEAGMALVLHFEALREAHARFLAERSAAYEAGRDRTEFTCESCGVVDRAQVKRRSVGTWEHHWPALLGPHLCDPCHQLAEVEVEIQRRKAVESRAAEKVAGRSRGDLVRVWIAENSERIMGS